MHVPSWVQITLAVLLFGFAMLGATNAVHVEAKVVYGVLNAVAGLWFASVVLPRRAPDGSA